MFASKNKDVVPRTDGRGGLSTKEPRCSICGKTGDLTQSGPGPHRFHGDCVNGAHNYYALIRDIGGDTSITKMAVWPSATKAKIRYPFPPFKAGPATHYHQIPERGRVMSKDAAFDAREFDYLRDGRVPDEVLSSLPPGKYRFERRRTLSETKWVPSGLEYVVAEK